MNIEIKDVVTLDNDIEYIVKSKTSYNNELYYYFVNSKDENDFKILRLNKNNNRLIEFENPDLIKTLLPLFLKETLNSLKKENSSQN